LISFVSLILIEQNLLIIRLKIKISVLLSFFFLVSYSQDKDVEFSVSESSVAKRQIAFLRQNTAPEKDVADTLLLLSKYYFGQNNDSVKMYAEKAVKIFLKLGNNEKAVETSILLSNALKFGGYFEEAMICIDSVLKKLDNQMDLHLKAECYMQLGEISRASGHQEGGLQLLSEALQIASETNNQQLKARIFNRKAATYFEKREYKLSINYADSSLTIAQTLNDNYLVINNYDILAAVYREKKEYENALALHFKSIELLKYVKDVNYIRPNIYLNISRTYLKMENYPEAIRYGEISYMMAKKLNILVYLENSSALLAYTYSKSKLFEQAYKYGDIVSNIRYIMKKQQHKQRMAELNVKYETEKKERLIQEKNNELLQDQLNLKNEKIQRKKMIFGLIALFVAILLLGMFYYNKRKNFRRISQQNDIISSKNQKLEQLTTQIKAQADKLAKTNKELSSLQNFKENMTSTYVHDLKNSLNTIIHFAQKREILKPAKNMLNLVLNILDVQKYESNKMELELRYHFLDDILNETVQNVTLLLEEKNILINKKYDRNIRLHADKNVIIRLCENLLTNAIKFSPLNGIILVESIQQSEGTIIVRIIDQGIGIPEENLTTIFEKNIQAKVEKSGSIQSTGLGLMYCKMAVEAHGGTINAMNNKNMPGITFAFTLPGNFDTIKPNIHDSDSDKQKAILNNIEQDKLKPFIDQLLSHKIYEASDILDIITNIDNSSNTVKYWKKQIANAVLSSNEKLYNNLLKSGTAKEFI